MVLEGDRLGDNMIKFELSELRSMYASHVADSQSPQTKKALNSSRKKSSIYWIPFWALGVMGIVDINPLLPE